MFFVLLFLALNFLTFPYRHTNIIHIRLLLLSLLCGEIALLDYMMREFLRSIVPKSHPQLSVEWEAFSLAAVDKINQVKKIKPPSNKFKWDEFVQMYMELVCKVCGCDKHDQQI